MWREGGGEKGVLGAYQTIWESGVADGGDGGGSYKKKKKDQRGD